MPFTLGNLGLAALAGGRPADAHVLFLRALAIADELDYTEALVYGLEGVAAALAATGAPERAATLLGAADAAATAASLVLEPLELRVHDETSAALADALGDDTFAALYAAGGKVGLRDAAADALGEQRPQVTA